jgi:signal transduction histidine kinase
VPALRQQAASVRTAAGHPIAVSVEAPAGLPRLPAAVEVAAYRIATEAVTNSARHSGTDLAWVCIELGDDCLAVTVRDPGPMTGGSGRSGTCTPASPPECPC